MIKLILNVLGYKKVLILTFTSTTKVEHITEILRLRKQFFNADNADFIIGDKEEIKVFYSAC